MAHQERIIVNQEAFERKKAKARRTLVREEYHTFPLPTNHGDDKSAL
jgi:hypothetical protein